MLLKGSSPYEKWGIQFIEALGVCVAPLKASEVSVLAIAAAVPVAPVAPTYMTKFNSMPGYPDPSSASSSSQRLKAWLNKFNAWAEASWQGGAPPRETAVNVMTNNRDLTWQRSLEGKVDWAKVDSSCSLPI